MATVQTNQHNHIPLALIRRIAAGCRSEINRARALSLRETRGLPMMMFIERKVGFTVYVM